MANGSPGATLIRMAPTVLEHAHDLRDLVELLAALRDRAGVLSVTVGIEPGAVSGRTPAWEIELENHLSALRRDGAMGRALARRRAEVSRRLAGLLEPAASGRGRALYMALESDATSEVVLQGALPTTIRLGRAAHVLPLVSALDRGRPAGLVSTSRDAVSVLECELGHARHVASVDLEPWVGDWWLEMKGPARANPLRGQQVVSHRDRTARRVAVAYRHALDDAAAELRTLARRRGWTRAVLAGDHRTVDVLEEALNGAGVATTTTATNLEGLRPARAVEYLRRELERFDARERARIAADVLSSEAGVRGLASALAALAEARVDRLLIDADKSFPGVVGPGELLAVAAEGEDRVDLTDLVVARALATGAEVTPLRGEAAEVLAPCDGIAARLRW